MTILTAPSRLAVTVQRGIVMAAALAAGLAGLGLLVYRGAQSEWRAILPGVIAVAVMLIAYGLLGGWLPARLERRDRRLLRLALAFGLAAGAVYAAEIVLEYVFLPADNTPYGLAEFGLVFLCYLAAGLVAALLTRQARNGALAAIDAALISTLVWYIAFLGVTYVFKGTLQQAAVFRAEGDLEDYARGGESNFDAWLVQDFFGAGFYHLLLALFVSVILGAAGGLAGTVLSWRPGRPKPGAA